MTGQTIDDIAAWLLDKACRSCGTALPAPGEPCTASGVLPEMTAPELAGEMDGPRAVAAVAAAKLRGEARQLQDAMLAKCLEADRVVHMAVLEERRTAAQRALEVALAGQREKARPLKAAQRAEAKASCDLQAAAARARDFARAEEIARRMRHGLTAESAAAVALAAATDVLARYQAALAEAQARREAAERDLASAAEHVRVMEAARDTAVAACSEPGRIPVSLETIGADLLRLLLTGALDPVETMIAQVPARWLADITGVTESVTAEARRALLQEQESEVTNKALHLRPLGDGTVQATPNPQSPQTPQVFHPPSPDARPSPYVPALTPRW